MNKLEKLAIRIGKISDEIQSLKEQREINLEHCHGSEDEHFNRPSTNSDNVPFENCLFNAYEWVKEDREEGVFTSFHSVIAHYGCKNCIGAYEAKQKIGLLKQERGRIVGNISTIGKSLRGES